MCLFRAATANDVQQILALWAESRSGHAETPDSAEAIRALLNTDPGSLLVAEDGDVIQGALIAAFDGWRGNMYRLAVRPDRRREGIARRLVEHGEARLRQRGAPKVTALVGRGDEQAEGLWRAAGYRDDTAIGRWVRSF
jgi:ribosomal protein S18 acetylase RimI-like enzyme